ncbi:MAG: Fe-S cluster assembly protein SufD [Thermoanaerobaculia bacterium]|nr:Fe-S cluster assembly protein SufD [Thermoanaerobaculia bacterium]
MDAAVAEVTNSYLAAFDTAGRSTSEPKSRPGLRREAMDRFAALGFPTKRHEDWRFTNVGPLGRSEYSLAVTPGKVTLEDLSLWIYPDMARAVFVDGHFVAELSDLEGLPEGVRVGGLAEALADGDTVAHEQLGRYASFDEQAFVALNTALFADGAFVSVPRRVVVERPIQLVFVTGPEAHRMCFPRNLIVAGEASQVTLIETYAGLGEDNFTCPVTELVADAGAVVDHYRLQQERTDATHIALQHYHCERDSNVSSHSLSFGGALVRNDVRAVLDGEGVECTLNGLYLTRGRQHVDNHMWVEHAKPNCNSYELYKGILEERSRAVFNGLIHVHHDAQKTDAKQTNRNLLLSADAMVHTNPQLVIHADDVKCTHGSTVGQLDADAVFYLRSRGISEEAAKSLLIYAFARDIVDRVRVEPVRKDLEEFLFSRLPKGEIVRQAV